MCTKYRRQCINDEVADTILVQFQHVAEINNCEIEEFGYEADHVHVLLSVPPQVCLSSVVNSMKTTSSRRVRQAHGEYLQKYYWEPLFWSRSYLILSSGGAPIEVIRGYIQEQGTEEHSNKVRKRKSRG